MYLPQLVRFLRPRLTGAFAVVLLLAAASAAQTQKSNYRVQEVMVPMRDGVRLQTVIITRRDQTQPLPILLTRTPYGVPTQEDFDQAAAKLGADWVPDSWRELAADGYIFVEQNLRGRFKSEGTFELTSRYDPNDPHQSNETNDAYDTIDWLVKNVPNNNGKVGMYGVSYNGLTAALALLHPHPALKAISEQASPVDQWMNDDMHRYGALRESYAFEYSVMEQASKTENTHFDFDTYDTYDWYLNLGPLSQANAKYLHGRIPFWNETMEHPNYDDFWKKEAWVRQLHSSTVPNLNVAGFWDQEDPWGPWQIFRHAAESDPNHADFMVAGPWFHGEWQTPEASNIGLLPFNGHKTALEFRTNIEAPFFRYYLHGQGEKPSWKVTTFQTGSDTWHAYTAWPPENAKPRNLYLHADGTLSFSSDATSGADYRQYVSDPADPVPYRERPISPTYPRPEWRTWEMADQRFVDHRPDVLTFVSAPLDHDLAVTGPLSADLFASTSGTDSDFIVKLIDVFPQSGQQTAIDEKNASYAQSMNGYELPIAMEVRRGRYLKSDENPQPLVANQPTEWQIPLRDHDHVFLKGHRIMVQVQSTWFPVIDRNPQKFVPNINQATAADYVPATQRVYCSPKLPSHIVLPVVQ
ncbi:MAG TPA: CocE/NonD family hydrolase [Acidobacteriaceae bacterium]|nr:CocE/NonD family hydrolase [Acidobacteriaceae bacterium]